MIKNLVIAIFLGALSIVAAAQTYHDAPAEGLWWNPTESGRGWTLETQNNITVVTHYSFRPDGSSTFFTTAGTWNGQTRSINASLFAFSGGQCVGCLYSRPISQDLGAIRFTFTSATNGQILYPNGSTIPIEKYNFVYGDGKAYLKGDWATAWVAVSSGLSFAHFLRFTTDCTTCSTPTVNGRQTLSTATGRVALAGPVTGSPGLYIVLIDATTNFYDYYYIIGSANSWSGLACTGRKTDPVPGLAQCAGLVYGSRTATHAALGTATVQQKNAEVPDELSRSKASSQSTDTVVPKEWVGVDVDWSPLIREMEKRSL